jgi:hypothetical protein
MHRLERAYEVNTAYFRGLLIQLILQDYLLLKCLPRTYPFKKRSKLRSCVE